MIWRQTTPSTNRYSTNLLARLSHWRARAFQLISSVVNDNSDKMAPRAIPEAAQRALAEARARREAEKTERAKEIGGRGGLDPARYGDWEVKGIACDF